MRHTGGLIASLLLLCLLAAPAARAQDGRPEKTSRPNIVFVMSDDHAWQAISAYGSNRNSTPNIDRLAREGMRLDRFFVGNSICAPSRATMLTGLHSHANGVATNGHRFDGSQANVAKLLGRAGYRSAMIGKWHLKTEPTGFDYYDRLVGQGHYYNPVFRRSAQEGGDPEAGGDYEQYQTTGYVTDVITDKAIGWLRDNAQNPSDRPFLMLVHHKAPHREWEPAPRHLTLFDDADLAVPPTLFDDWSGKGEPAALQEMTIDRHLRPIDLKLTFPKRLNETQRRAWERAYGPKNAAYEAAVQGGDLEGDDLLRWKYQRYAKDYLRCVQAVDDSVGRILDELDHQGLSDNTIVIYTSDQGWYLGEHGWYDKRWMYEESFRTPFLVRWPGVIEAGSTDTTLTQNIDIAPTRLDAAGLETPGTMHGRSMLGVLRGETPSDWRESLYYRYTEYPGVHAVRRHEGVRTRCDKLIRFFGPDADSWEYYDLEADPDEVRNAIDDPKHTARIAELRDELARLKTRYGVED
jgi:arylsulfatase A-like enzyme